MKFLTLITLLLILSASLANGQSEVSVVKKEFKTDKPGFDEAWQHVKNGDSFYSKRGVWYSSAVTQYLSAIAYNNKNAELNYKLGVSYLLSDKKERASEYLLKALSLKPGITDDILLLTGRSLQYTSHFSEATKKINEWLASGTKKSPENIEKANKYLVECKSADSVYKDTLRISIKNLGGNINSSADDYSEVINGDATKMYFASRRELSADSKNYYSDTKSDENIFRSDFENDKWSVSLLAGKNLKTEYCETPLDLDKTGTILYIYAGYEGNGDIKVSEFKKGEWRSPDPESFGINSTEPETSFSISPSGDEIAFVSDRGKKGTGGKDIYFSYKNGHKWSKAVNAGVNINSDLNEESVRFSRGGDTLWFSSSGHNTTGGFDIFYSMRKDGGGWQPAINAGYPVNTQWDEFFYYPSPVSNGLFYFVSNRSGGFGGLDIYAGQILPKLPVKHIVAPASIQIKTDSIHVKNDTLNIKTDTINIKTDSIAKIIVQPPDTIAVRDTAAVRKTIIK